ncbi:MAG TPA: hypothetical protein VMX33_09755 [bacterium]|nr:hypothetical protein [bacterium]
MAAVFGFATAGAVVGLVDAAGLVAALAELAAPGFDTCEAGGTVAGAGADGLTAAVGAGALGSGSLTGANVITGEAESTVISTVGFREGRGEAGTGNWTSGTASIVFPEAAAGAPWNIAIGSGLTESGAAVLIVAAGAFSLTGFG